MEDQLTLQEIFAKLEALSEKLELVFQSALLGNKENLTIEETSLYTGLSVKTIYNYSHRKLIPHSKLGARLIFNKAAIDEWLTKDFKKTAPDLEREAATRLALMRLPKRKTHS